MKISPRRWMLPAVAALMAGSAAAQEPVKLHVEVREDPAAAIRAEYNERLTLAPDAKIAWERALGRPESDGLGAALAAIEPALRGHLGLAENVGLVVVEVHDGGRAAKAGLKANDILLTLAGQPLNEGHDLLAVLKGWSQSHPADSYELKLLRGGKPLAIKVKAEVRVILGSTSEEAPDYYIGTPVNPLDATYRAHLDIAEGTGLIVGEVQDGSPAAKAGVKPGDILCLFDGKPLPDINALRSSVQAKGPHPAKLQVLRAGRMAEVVVTPEPRKPEPESTQVKGNTMLDLFTANQLVTEDVQVLQGVPFVRRLYTVPKAQQLTGSVDYQAFAPQALLTQAAPPADVAKKIDELTAQVQALTKAVESLRAAQGEKK